MTKVNWKRLFSVASLALALSALSLTACATQTPESAGASRWDSPVAKVEAALKSAVAAYDKGEKERAMQLAKDAYFDAFESSGLETAIRLDISSQRAFEIEYSFTEINQLLRSGAESSKIQQKISELMGIIREDTSHLGKSGEGSTTSGFLTSFFIIVREGFEAILIIGAIIAYLVKSGNGAKVRVIYQSAIFAILASIATAVVVKYLLKISGASRGLLEGVTLLIAVAVLFSVSFWLLGKVQAQKWQQYIQSKVSQSLSTGSTMALWFAAFLAVYREGAETVLFYLALISGSQSNQLGSIGLGIAAGAIVLVAIFFIIRLGSLRIPLKPFFIGTGVLLYYMAFVFAGKGIRELQEAGIIGTGLLPSLPSVEFLGIYPTWQGVALQSALLLAAGAGLAYQYFSRPHPAVADKKAAS